MTSFLLYVEEKLVKVNYEGKIRGGCEKLKKRVFLRM